MLSSVSDDELAEIVKRQLLDVQDPNLAPNSPGTWVYYLALADRVKTLRAAMPTFGRGPAGFNMLGPTRLMAELMHIDPIEFERRQTESLVQFRQRLTHMINQRVSFVQIAERQGMPNHVTAPADAAFLNNAAADAFTDQADPTLTNDMAARVARAVWYGGHGHSITIYRAMDWVIQNNQDQTAVTLSAMPPAAVPTVTNGILNHLINANLRRTVGGQMRRRKVSRLIVAAAQQNSHLAIRALHGMTPQSLNEAQGHVGQAVLAAAQNNSAAVMAELARPNMIQPVGGVASNLGAAHCHLAIQRATTTAELRILYGAFANGTVYGNNQIMGLNGMRRERMLRMLRRDLDAESQLLPVLPHELHFLAVLPNQPIGSGNAFQLIMAILNDRVVDGQPQPHPHRALLVTFAITHLLPQVTTATERANLHFSGFAEFENYDFASNTFN